MFKEWAEKQQENTEGPEQPEMRNLGYSSHRKEESAVANMAEKASKTQAEKYSVGLASRRDWCLLWEPGVVD